MSESRPSSALARLAPAALLAPSVLTTLIFIYGFIAYTTILSFTNSSFVPSFEFVRLRQYERLFANPRWEVAMENIAIFGILYIVLTTLIGLFLAILLDQKVRFEGAIRTIYLYPMALSFIVTGVVWQWILNPGLGIERVVQSFGWESFEFDWLVDSDMAIYCVVIAGVWQASGFVMSMFLAGLRGINPEILRAASIDGAGPVATYRRVVIPMLRPVFLSALVVQAHLAIKSYDLVVALTKGGPGYATELPSTFMYSSTFTRSDMGLGSASAVIMLITIAAIIVPYLFSELREDRRV